MEKIGHLYLTITRGENEAAMQWQVDNQRYKRRHQFFLE